MKKILSFLTLAILLLTGLEAQAYTKTLEYGKKYTLSAVKPDGSVLLYTYVDGTTWKGADALTLSDEYFFEVVNIDGVDYLKNVGTGKFLQHDGSFNTTTSATGNAFSVYDPNEGDYIALVTTATGGTPCRAHCMKADKSTANGGYWSNATAAGSYSSASGNTTWYVRFLATEASAKEAYLKPALDAAADKIALNQGNVAQHTAEAKAALQTAWNTANAVYTDPDATNEQAQAAATALQAAIAAYDASDLIMPEEGQIYYLNLRNGSDDATARVEHNLFDNNDNLPLKWNSVENGNTPPYGTGSPFVVSIVDGKYVFRSAYGRYIMTRTAGSGKSLDNMTTTYTAGGAKHDIYLITDGKPNKADLVYLKNAQGGRVIIYNQTTGVDDSSGAPFYNGTYSSGISMVPATGYTAYKVVFTGDVPANATATWNGVTITNGDAAPYFIATTFAVSDVTAPVEPGVTRTITLSDNVVTVNYTTSTYTDIFEEGKVYNIVSSAYSGTWSMCEKTNDNNQAYGRSGVTSAPEELWLVTSAAGDGTAPYYFRNLNTGRYLQLVEVNNAEWPDQTSNAKTDNAKFYVTFDGEGAYYTLSTTSAMADLTCVHLASGKSIVRWNKGADSEPSRWRLYEVADASAYDIYDINVVGLSDPTQGGVTANGVTPVGKSTLCNGEAFFFAQGTVLDASNFTPVAVSGYTPNVSVTGHTITVSYATTYTVSITDCPEGAVIFNETEYADGATIPNAVIASASELSLKAVAGYTPVSVTVSGTTITGKYGVDYTFNPSEMFAGKTVKMIGEEVTSLTPNASQWYLLKQDRGWLTPVGDEGKDEVIMRAGTNNVVTAGSNAADVQKYLVRFVPSNEYPGACYIQFGTSNFMGDAASPLVSSETPGNFLVYPATQETAGRVGHFAINKTTDGTTYGNKLDNNGANNNMVWYGNGQTVSGTNNIWALYPVYFDALTYNYQIDGQTIKTESFGLGAGDAYPTVTLPDFVSATLPTGTIAADNEEHDIALDLSGYPFQFSADYAQASNAYYVKSNSNAGWNMYYNGGSSFKNDQTGNPVSTGVDGNVYIWSFVGNPFDGFEVYNLKGASRFIKSNGGAVGDVATMDYEGTKFKVVASLAGTQGFTNPFALVPADAAGKFLSAENDGTFSFTTTNSEVNAFTVSAAAPQVPTYEKTYGALPEGWYQFRNCDGNGWGTSHIETREAGYVTPVYTSENLGYSTFNLELVTPAQGVGKEGVFYIKPTETKDVYTLRTWNNFYVTEEGKSSTPEVDIYIRDRGNGEYSMGDNGYNRLQGILKGKQLGNLPPYIHNFVGDTKMCPTGPNEPLWSISKVNTTDLYDYFHYYVLEVTGLTAKQIKTAMVTCHDEQTGTTIPMTSGGTFIFESQEEPVLTESDFDAPDFEGFTRTITIQQTPERKVIVAYTRTAPDKPDFDPVALGDFAEGWVQVAYYGEKDETYATKADAPLLTSKMPEETIDGGVRPAGFDVLKNESSLDVLGTTFAYLTVVNKNSGYNTINLRLANGRYIGANGETSLTASPIEVTYDSESWSTQALVWANHHDAEGRLAWQNADNAGDKYVDEGVTQNNFETSSAQLAEHGLQPWSVQIIDNTGDFTVSYVGTTQPNYGLDEVYDKGTFFFYDSFVPQASDFSSTKPYYTFHIDATQHKIIVDGLVPDDEKEKVLSMLNNHGLGYPTEDCTSRTALAAAIEDPTTTMSQLTPLYNAFIAETDIVLPINAHAYSFKNVHPTLGDVWMKYTYDGNLSYTKNESRATKFVCHTIGGNYFAFAIHDDGASHNITKYLVFAGGEEAKGAAGLKGFTDGYTKASNDAPYGTIVIAKHGYSGFCDAAVNGIEDFFGKVRLNAIEKDGVSTSDFIVTTKAVQYDADETLTEHFGTDIQNFQSSSAWVMKEWTDYKVNQVKLVDGQDGCSYITTYLPYAVELPEDVKAYKAVRPAYQWTTVDLVEVGQGVNEDENVVPAGTGVVLRKDDSTGGTYLLTPALVTESKTIEDNCFRGVTVSTPVSAFTGEGETCFVLSRMTGLPIGFYVWNDTKTLAAYKAYYLNSSNYESETNGLTLNFLGEDTEGVKGATVEKSDDTLYDLQGRRVEKTSKGKIYIKNGKTQLF